LSRYGLCYLPIGCIRFLGYFICSCEDEELEDEDEIEDDEDDEDFYLFYLLFY
jgi:hypothetical protein